MHVVYQFARDVLIQLNSQFVVLFCMKSVHWLTFGRVTVGWVGLTEVAVEQISLMNLFNELILNENKLKITALNHPIIKHFIQSHEWQHHGGAKGEFRESPKSLELILWKMKKNTILTSACKIAPDSWLKYSNYPSLIQSALSVWYCSHTRRVGFNDGRSPPTRHHRVHTNVRLRFITHQDAEWSPLMDPYVID